MAASLPGSGIRRPGSGGSGFFYASGLRGGYRSALEIRIEAHAATSFVGALRPQEDAVAARHEALSVVRWIAAHHANRQRLGDVFRNGEQLRHRLEWLAEVILVESGNNHALSAIGQFVDDGWQLLIEELSFVDADHFRVVLDEVEQRA